MAEKKKKESFAESPVDPFSTKKEKERGGNLNVLVKNLTPDLRGNWVEENGAFNTPIQSLGRGYWSLALFNF